MDDDRVGLPTMSQASLRAHALFFGNLNDELPKLQIASLLLQLARHCTGRAPKPRDIWIRFSQPSNCFTATLKLPSEDEQQRALLRISECDQIPSGLVKTGRKLIVDYYKEPHQRRIGKFLDDQLDFGPDDDDDGGRIFFKGQHLGAETRMLEFKEMAHLNLQYLRRTVSRYLCAFLNSSGGSLMLGVDDGGNVQGTPLTHKEEDEVRLCIDQIVNHFDPPVLPQMYSLTFPTVKTRGDNYSRGGSTLKVVKLTVCAGRANTLYACPNGDVFIRRDGSVQGPLKPREIQEWCNMNFDSKEQAYQQEISDLQARLRQAEYDRQSQITTTDQSLKKTKSAVCSIL